MPSSPYWHLFVSHQAFDTERKEHAEGKQQGGRGGRDCCVCLTEAQVRTRSRHVSSQVTLLLGLGQHHAWDTKEEASAMWNSRRAPSKCPDKGQCRSILPRRIDLAAPVSLPVLLFLGNLRQLQHRLGPRKRRSPRPAPGGLKPRGHSPAAIRSYLQSVSPMCRGVLHRVFRTFNTRPAA